MKRIAILFSVIFTLAISSSNAREVLGWISSDAMKNATKILKLNCGAYSPKDGLSAIALQAWIPKNGSIYLDTAHGASIVLVQQIKRVADSLNLRTLLCVYNLVNSKWDWTGVAVPAFKTNKTAFIKAIVDEVNLYTLDGVDIDLEGPTEYPNDRAPYADFIKELGTQLHAQGKTLSIASFFTPCYCAPNLAWWKDLKGYVDNMHTMNYNDGYEYCEKTIADCTEDETQNNKKVYKYSYTVSYGLNSGIDTASISIGVMVSASWGSPAQPVTYHLQSILDLPAIPGLCIWELGYIGSGAWTTSEVWQKIAAIKNYGNNTAISAKQTEKIKTPFPDTYSKVTRNSLVVPECFRGDGHYAELYSIQGKFLDKIHLSKARIIYFNDSRTSLGVHIVKFR